MAFRGDSTATYTFTSGNGSTVDLGARNNYRYINATNVYNKGKADGSVSDNVIYTLACIRFEATGSNYRNYVITNQSGKVVTTNNAYYVSTDDDYIFFNSPNYTISLTVKKPCTVFSYNNTSTHYNANSSVPDMKDNNFYIIIFDN